MDVRSSFLKLVHGRRGPASPEELDRRIRAPRVAIEPLHRIWFIRTTPAPTRVVPVANVSTTGIGLVSHPDVVWPEVGGSVSGSVVVASASYPMTLRVVHVTGNMVGCAFTSPSSALAAALEEHLSVELETLGLIDMPEPEPGATSDAVAHWFSGRHTSQLYLVERDRRVLFFSLVFHGNYLEGGEGQPVRFGVISSQARADDDAGDPIEWVDTIDAEQLAMTIRCIASMPGLESSYRKGILQHLR